MRRWRAAVVVLGLGLLTVLAAQGTAADAPGKPRLVVLIVFDQMRGDYLARWNDLFTGDGFRRLEREGTWFTNCHYPYAGTQTGPGHASLATGCSPDRHGIVTNDWFDRAAGQSVYCATTDRYSTVGRTPVTGSTTAPALSSPRPTTATRRTPGSRSTTVPNRPTAGSPPSGPASAATWTTRSTAGRTT
jgi:hypothetical protein